jgi:hypothetical protein
LPQTNGKTEEDPNNYERVAAAGYVTTLKHFNEQAHKK